MSRNYSSIASEKQLASNVTNVATQITLDNATGLPTPPFMLVLNPDTTIEEIVLVNTNQSGVTSPTFIVTRAQDGTAAQVHTAGQAVRHMIVGSDLQLVSTHTDATAVHGATGTVVGTTNTQTLTNKTLTSPKINENVAVTATATEINLLDGVTASTAEINYLDGVTSSIQTQFNNIQTVPSGVISAFGGSSAPTGYLLCDGTAVSRTTYSALYAVVGTTYGVGDNSTTFNVPNLKGKVAVGRDSSQSEFDTLGETGGAKTVSLTEAQMPPHIHSINPSMIVGGGHVQYPNTGTAYSPLGNSPSANVTITSAGGTAGTVEAHPNLQPYLVINYIIKT
jgi:microcystin-dependent protein